MLTVKEKSHCFVQDLGVVDYDIAYKRQKQCVTDLLEGGSQAILLCEHLPTLTLGRLADESHLLISDEEISKRNIMVRHIDRGGDITLHAPGQLTIYPILDLTYFGKDLKVYLHQLEQVAIDLCSEFGIVANRFPGQTGAWIGKNKIASIGIGVRKWITYHGLAVNISTDLSLFSMIKPCGLDVTMTTMSNAAMKAIKMQNVKDKIVKIFSDNFNIDVWSK